MHLYFIGCECTGKTTLAAQVLGWAERHMGECRHFHDHMTVPCTEMSAEARKSYRNAHPQVKETLQRYMIEYHVSPMFYDDMPDHNLMGMAIEEAVYAPLYYGYGDKDSATTSRSPAGQRTQMARDIERRILEHAPWTVLVLLTASPRVIRERMAREPTSAPDAPTRGVVRPEDVEHVLGRFREEFDASLLTNRIVLDTTDLAPDRMLDAFLERYDPFITDADRARMKTHAGG